MIDIPDKTLRDALDEMLGAISSEPLSDDEAKKALPALREALSRRGYSFALKRFGHA